MVRSAWAVRAAAAVLLVASHAAPSLAVREGDQGIGAMIGNPSGFTWKMFLDDQIAVDAAFGVAQSELDAHVTLLFHNYQALGRSEAFANTASKGDIPLYVGVGPRALFEDDTEFGIRVPVGISYLPHDNPMEGFVEIAPVIRLTPETGMDLDFALGVRYYFEAIRPRAAN